jgi:hypothetical protein
VTAERGPNKTTYEVISSIYANDLATDATKPGTTKPVSIGLLLWQASTGEAVIAIRGTEGLLEWFQDAKFGTTSCFFLPEAGETEDGFTGMYKSFAVSTPAGDSVTNLHLLSKLAGGETLPLRPICNTPAGLAKFWNHLGIEFRSNEQLTKDIRTEAGGVLAGRT